MQPELIRTSNKAIRPGDPRTVFRLFVLITWGLLLLPIYPLVSYTSMNAVIWQKYSVPYAGLLLTYLSLLLLWPLLLAFPEKKVNQVSQLIISVNQRSWIHVELVVVWIILPQLVLLTIRLWGWGYNNLLRFAILLMGLWLSLVPSWWNWGLEGWQVSGRSRIFALRSWMTQNVFLWVRPLVAGGVLLLSMALALKGSPGQLMLILLLLPGIGGVLTFMRWPALGLVAVIGALMIPFRGPSQLSATMPLVALLLGLWIVDMMLRQRISLVHSRPVRPLLVFVLIAILAFGVGQLPWYTFASAAPLGAQLGGLALFVLSAAAFLLVAHHVRDIRWLQAMTWVLLTLGGLYSVGQVVPGFGWIINLFPEGAISDSMFFTWVVVLAFSQALFNRQLATAWRLLLVGVVLITFYEAGVRNYDWKSGWLPAVVAVGAVMAFRWWRLVPLLVLAALPLAPIVVSRIISSDEYSYSTRVDAWLIIVKIAQVNPILGLGPANYYWYTPLFPIRGYAVQFNSHNQYIDLFAQTGILGLIGFVWFFAIVGWLGWDLKTRVPEGFARAYVYGALGGLVGTLVAAALGDWVIPFFYNVTLYGFRVSVLPWLFLGGLVALEQMFSHQETVVDSGE